MGAAAQRPGSIVSRVPRAEAIARALETEILGEGALPGARLGTKDELRQRFGVAVATVNEAVRLLERRGIVEARPGPGGGVFVAGPSARVNGGASEPTPWGTADVADYVAIRNAVEPLVFRDAALYRGAADVRALTALLDEMQRRSSDPTACWQLSWGFHRRVAKMCRNAPLHSIYLTVLDHLEHRVRVSDVRVSDIAVRLGAHRDLLEGIQAGPGLRLDRAIRRHAALPIPRSPSGALRND